MNNDYYNRIPVLACKRCLSLAIHSEDATEPSEEGMKSSEQRVCLDCGCDEITSYIFDNWEKKYIEKYGVKFIEGL